MKHLSVEKALDTYGNLVKKTLGANSKDFDFKASRRWFEKYKKEVEFTVYLDMARRQVQTRKRQRSLKIDPVTLFKAEGLVPQQVFNGDKTGLFF